MDYFIPRLVKRNPEVEPQPLFFGREVLMKKVACLIYPNFSIYEIATLTSSLVLSFGVEVDYVASRKDTILSEDGLSCQPTKLIDKVNLHDYSCIILPGMADFIPVLRDKQLIKFLTTLSDKDIVIAAISSAPILLAKAGLLDNKKFTGGIWQNFFGYFDFLKRDNFRPKLVHQDKNIITAIGFAHQEFARTVLVALGLTDNASQYFRDPCYRDLREEDLLFALSDADFNEFKRDFELQID